MEHRTLKTQLTASPEALYLSRGCRLTLTLGCLLYLCCCLPGASLTSRREPHLGRGVPLGSGDIYFCDHRLFNKRSGDGDFLGCSPGNSFVSGLVIQDDWTGWE